MIAVGAAGGFACASSWPPEWLKRLKDSPLPLVAALPLVGRSGLCWRAGVGTAKFIVLGRKLPTPPRISQRDIAGCLDREVTRPERPRTIQLDSQRDNEDCHDCGVSQAPGS